MRIIALAALLATGAGLIAAQSRAQELAAAFTKQKHVVSDKRGVRREKYKDVRSEPVVKPDVSGYSGLYQTNDFGDAIELHVAQNGTIQATGHDSDRPDRTFVLENAKIQAAVLTATKVYRDGAREPFEGVFINRIERTAPKDPGTTTFGLGVVLAKPRYFEGNTHDRLFYALTP